jgi:prevent-host-death family protein
MNTITIPATKLKGDVSNILDEVYFRGTTAVIERYGKPVAKIVPVETKKKGKNEMKEFLERTFGSIPDFPDVTKMRYSRDRSHIKL